MGRFLVGLLVGVVVVLGAEFLFLTGGGMPVAARGARALPLEQYLVNEALEHAVEQDARRPSPMPANEETLLAGAKVYRDGCELCHGLPGSSRRTPIAMGMFPRPPMLMPPEKGVTDDPVGETYWKVKNGIRLSGMPSFEGTLTEEQLWQVSLLLEKADQLPPRVLAALTPPRPERVEGRAGARPGGPAGAPTPPDHR